MSKNPVDFGSLFSDDRKLLFLDGHKALYKTDGRVTAGIIADCAATGASFTTGVMNSGSLTATTMLSVSVSPDTPPVLGNYPSSAGIINVGTGATITPDASPSDNLGINSIFDTLKFMFIKVQATGVGKFIL